jgi:hypothetical protein
VLIFPYRNLAINKFQNILNILDILTLNKNGVKKMKKIIFLITAIFFSTSLLANQATERNQKIGEELEYDAAKGYWWYKEKYKDKKTGEEFQTKTKLSNKEKMKHDKEKKTEKLLKIQIIELKKISKRLDYAYPNLTPEYTSL